MKNIKFSIVIPIYFNEKNLPVTYPRLVALEKQIPGISLELVFVDDGSGDRSFQVLKEIQASDPRVKVVKLARNFGSFNAILAGLHHATGDCVGIISADLQDPPELFEQMIEDWRKGKKTVMAVRQDRQDPFFSKVFANIFYKMLRKVALPSMPEGGFDFVLIDRIVVDVLTSIHEKNTSIMALIAWLGFDHSEIGYVRGERRIGKSRWTFSKKLKLFVDLFTGFSFFPIRSISVLGSFIAVVSFFYGGYLMHLRFVNGIHVEGWTSLVVMILFLSGFQLISLGIIGEYLWRNFDESRRRPPYIVEEVLVSGNRK
jgi:polyisoprenyl-phosphate glycosyltransferase